MSGSSVISGTTVTVSLYLMESLSRRIKDLGVNSSLKSAQRAAGMARDPGGLDVGVRRSFAGQCVRVSLCLLHILFFPMLFILFSD